ncbi:MAG: translation initiation factor IF-2 [Deltaproteobacteria bacterium]|nr:translation initiation factor IF-2 [Deltaproteobacteria bacterium]
MGKVRVYELAKKLNISNKELVGKLQEMGFPVKSHSSTIEESQIKEVENLLLGGKAQAAVETKTRATVIRRRKKIVEIATEEVVVPETVEEAAEAEAVTEAVDEEPVEVLAEESEPAEAVAEEPDEAAAEEVTAEEVVEAEAPEAVEVSKIDEEETGTAQAEKVPVEEDGAEKEEVTAAKTEVKPKIRKIGRSKSEPAKIISRPKIVPVEPQPEKKRVSEKKARPKPPVEKVPALEAVPPVFPPDPDEKKSKKKKKGRVKAQETTDEETPRKKAPRRREVIEQTDLYDNDSMGRSRASRYHRAARAAKKSQKTVITTPSAIKRRVKVAEAVSVSDLARKMGIKAQDVLRKLMSMGTTASLNQSLDFDSAALVAAEFDFELTKDSFDEEQMLSTAETKEEEKVIRPPVVTVMGHVDHGKTSLLDAIRRTDVISGEAGGITQHIGAYHVRVKQKAITFLDTPGHEAFTSMRARGAQITDLVILVVAADDGVMEQSREAIDHAKAAGVPILVAVNKIDKPEANPEQIKRAVSELGLVPEEWGGDTLFANISAKTGEGIDELLDVILLQAEMLELKGRPTGRAEGRVIEARLDRGRGPMATVLIQNGVLKAGDPFVCGVYRGKVRALLDERGDYLEQAGPSMPVEIQGIAGVPNAGDEFVVLEDERKTKQVSQYRQQKQRENELLKTSKITLENLYDRIKEGELKELNVVINADVQGSLEAISDALGRLATSVIKVNVIRSSTGSISDTDIMLAAASEAMIIGFNIRPNSAVQDLADSENVEIRYYDVIYKLTEEVKDAMVGLLDPIYVERSIGQAEVKEAFHVSKVGTVAGSAVTSGKITRAAKVRLLRDGVVLFDGEMASLKRFKEDAREVANGYECGIALANFDDIKTGDLIEAYIIEERAGTL